MSLTNLQFEINFFSTKLFSTSTTSFIFVFRIFGIMNTFESKLYFNINIIADLFS